MGKNTVKHIFEVLMMEERCKNIYFVVAFALCRKHFWTFIAFHVSRYIHTHTQYSIHKYIFYFLLYFTLHFIFRYSEFWNRHSRKKSVFTAIYTFTKITYYYDDKNLTIYIYIEKEARINRERLWINWIYNTITHMLEKSVEFFFSICDCLY